MKSLKIFLFAVLLLAGVVACNKSTNAPTPLPFVSTEKVTDEGETITIKRQSYEPFTSLDLSHAHYQIEVNRLISNGGLVVTNDFRSDESLTREGVNIRNDNSVSYPLYDPTIDGIWNPINPGHPEIQIRQYYVPIHETYVQVEVYWGNSFLEDDLSLGQSNWTCKWWRFEDSQDDRILTNNIRLSPKSAFGMRDGDDIYEVNQYEEIISDAHEARMIWEGAPELVTDNQPGGETECMRLGRRHPDQGDPKPCYEVEGGHWYRYTFHLDPVNGRYKAWVQDLGDPSDISSNRQRPWFVMDFPVEGWERGSFNTYVTGMWINSSGRQEGDWGNHQPMGNGIRNLIVSTKRINLDNVLLTHYPGPVQD